MRLDRRLRARNRIPLEQWVPSKCESVSPIHQGKGTWESGAGDEPMQVGQVSFCSSDRDFRKLNKLCYFCGNKGNFVYTCPYVKPQSSNKNRQRCSQNEKEASLTLGGVNLVSEQAKTHVP